MQPSGSNGISITMKGTKEVLAWLKQSKVKSEKAMKTAMKVESFRLKNKLQKELRRGAPGGRSLAPLSFISRKMGRGSVNRKPLSRLARIVRYRVAKQNPFKMEIGFVQPGSGSHKLSKSWQRKITKLQQDGFSQDITAKQRGYIIRRGGELGKIEGGEIPFFLKQSTRTFRTPGRPIINPFWQANKRAVPKNIKKNFKKKMKGIRI